MARKLDASFYNIWAPAIAQNEDAPRCQVRALDQGSAHIGVRADIIMISIGEAAKTASLFRMGYLSSTDLQRLIGKGAVGDILCRYFDARDRSSTMKSMTRDRDSHEVFGDERKLIIGVGGGSAKVDAIRAALLKKYINVLITDEGTAAELLRD